MRVRGLRDFITNRMTKAFLQAAHLKCGKKPGLTGPGGNLKLVKLESVAYGGDTEEDPDYRQGERKEKRAHRTLLSCTVDVHCDETN